MENTHPGLDLFLHRRLCRSLEASSGDLWTLPTLGVPDHVLRNHIDDKSLRALHAFLGLQIFSPAIDSAIAQTFDSYPGHVRAVIVSQLSSSAVLARIAGRLPLYAHKIPSVSGSPHEIDPYKAQLLYAAVSALAEHHGEECAIQWLKTLVGNLVPVIMEAIADWDDLNINDEGGIGGFEKGEYKEQPKTLLVDSELDDSDLAELLETHLRGLDPHDQEV
ncbi:hypothetical protein FRC10_008804 [Ceratobasidium sp. 414]|nr:hypothetical protein FRC10_008804 [Ceratobasidium sp. 414]